MRDDAIINSLPLRVIIWTSLTIGYDIIRQKKDARETTAHCVG